MLEHINEDNFKENCEYFNMVLEYLPEKVEIPSMFWIRLCKIYQKINKICTDYESTSTFCRSNLFEVLKNILTDGSVEHHDKANLLLPIRDEVKRYLLRMMQTPSIASYENKLNVVNNELEFRHLLRVYS